MWTIVWVMLGLCAVIAFLQVNYILHGSLAIFDRIYFSPACMQLILMLLASMLFVLISEELLHSKVRVSPAPFNGNESILLSSYNHNGNSMRTTHFFNSSSQIYPGSNQTGHRAHNNSTLLQSVRNLSTEEQRAKQADKEPLLIPVKNYPPSKLTHANATTITSTTTNNQVNIQTFQSTSSTNQAKPNAGLPSSVSPLSGTNLPSLISKEKSTTKSQSSFRKFIERWTPTTRRSKVVQVLPRNSGTVSPTLLKVSSTNQQAATLSETNPQHLIRSHTISQFSSKESNRPTKVQVSPRNGGIVSTTLLNSNVSSPLEATSTTQQAATSETSPQHLIRSHTISQFSSKETSTNRPTKVQVSPRNGGGTVSPTLLKASTPMEATSTTQQAATLSETSPHYLISNEKSTTKSQSSFRKFLERWTPTRSSKVQVSPRNRGMVSTTLLNSNVSPPLEATSTTQQAATSETTPQHLIRSHTISQFSSKESSTNRPTKVQVSPRNRGMVSTTLLNSNVSSPLEATSTKQQAATLSETNTQHLVCSVCHHTTSQFSSEESSTSNRPTKVQVPPRNGEELSPTKQQAAKPSETSPRYLIRRAKSDTMLSQFSSKEASTSRSNRPTKVQVSPRNREKLAPTSLKGSSQMEGRATFTKQQTEFKIHQQSTFSEASPPSLIHSDKRTTKSHYSWLMERLAPTRSSMVQGSPRNGGKVSPTSLKVASPMDGTVMIASKGQKSGSTATRNQQPEVKRKFNTVDV